MKSHLTIDHDAAGIPPEPAAIHRNCSGCGAKLNIYNKSKTCAPCSKAGKGKPNTSGQHTFKARGKA